MPKTVLEHLEELDKITDNETKIITGFIVRTNDGEFLDIDGDLGGFAAEYIPLHETYADADNAGEEAAGETEEGFEYSVLAMNIVLSPATSELKTGADVLGAAYKSVGG
jgi:hypothetical protein